MVTESQCRLIGLVAVLNELSKDDLAILWHQEIVDLCGLAIAVSNQNGAENSWVGQVDRQGGSFDDREIIDIATWR
jgi:hypothetical protein